MVNVGDHIGNYRIIDEINTNVGAFGSIYKGQHLIFTDELPIAIKILRTKIGSQQEHERCIQEARLQKKLKHPHILPLIEAGIHKHSLYLVMEYAPNGTLRDLISRRRNKPLPAERAITILSQIGQALHYAHQQNIVHRDLKPENILFNAQYEPLLADFGIATVLETARTQHMDGSGTPAYMAPEQFEGTVSTKSDQYALGCIAYELVTGQKPFAVSYDAMWYHHAKVSPVPPSQLNPDLPLHIEYAILKAMAKERTDRYEDVAAFIAALHADTRAERGPDIRYELTITFEEAVWGCQKECTLPRWETCQRCHGETSTTMTMCAQCHGRGLIRNNRCMIVNIPAGVDDGINVRVIGEGCVSSPGGIPGNLYVVLTVKPHPFFQRQGDDIIYTLPLRSHQARHGCKVEIPTLDDKKTMLEIPPGTQNGCAFRLKGLGVPLVHGSERGDFYVIVKVD
jgi:serine/threonine protein kinase